MPLEVAREQGPRLNEALSILVAAEPYLAYANFDPIVRREGAVFGIHMRRWSMLADDLGAFVARDRQDRPLAAIGLEHRDFESRHFDSMVARVESPLAVAEENQRLEALRALYGHAAKVLADGGYQHLTASASAHDRVGCWALQETGAFHVGTRISWMQTLHGRPQQHNLPSHLRIEVHDRSTFQRFDPASWSRLREWSGQGFDRGPFVFDLNSVDREGDERRVGGCSAGGA
jgi:hypothetical protein